MAGRDDSLSELGATLGKLWSSGRDQVGRAGRRARELLALRQLKNDRDGMYRKLGKEALELVDAGELDHPGLLRGRDRIRALEARIRDAEDALRAGGVDPDEGPPAEPAGG
jgi:hypothetical protein